MSIKIVNKESVRTDPAFEKVRTKAINWIETTTQTDMDSLYFHPDRFEVMVDARGFNPENLKCIVNPSSIEIAGVRTEILNGTQRQLESSRNYQLPSPVLPAQAICCLSSEGVLLVSAPWQR